MKTTFIQTSVPDPHIGRRQEILKNHPEIRALFGPNPYSFALIVLLVAVQLTIAYWLGKVHWSWSLLTAFFIGAYVVGALNALIHDAAHDLIFRTATGNRLSAMVANIPLVTVSAESFRRYHYDHHFSMGDYRQDVGIPTVWEASWVSNSSWRKALWLFFFVFFQLGRTKKYVSRKVFMDRWMLANFVLMLSVNALLLYFMGILPVVYLFLSFFFSFGFHPVGARVIQEHFVLEEAQETNNYSGAANILECNFGCHNEHHDFPRIPWNRLPKVSRLAKAYYTPLQQHRSRWKLIWVFITDPSWDLYLHTVRSGYWVSEKQTGTDVNW